MNAQQLKNSILQEAIEGRLVPQDPNDEPASVLLERIREEKKRLVKEEKLKKKDLEEIPINEDEKPFEIPESWEWCSFGNVISLLSGRDLTPQEYSENMIGIPYITGASNFDGESLIINRWTTKPVTISKYGDLLITCKGTIGTMAYNLIGDIHIARQVMAISPYIADIRYVKYFLMRIVYELEKKAKSIIPGISREDILNAKLPLPPLAEQKRIVAKIEELLPKVEEYGKAQETLNKLNEEMPERLKKSILQEAIEGRLVPQDPNDEPASVLLERIRKEKEKLVKEGKLNKKDNIYNNVSDEEKLFDIPCSWEWVRLFDIIDVIYGYPFDSNKFNEIGEGFPLIRIRDIIPSSTKTYTTEKANQQYIIKKGDMIVGMDGNFNVRFWQSEDAYLNQRVCKLIAKNDYLNQKFLYYYLPIALDEVFKTVSFVTVKHLSDKHLRLMVIPLPPLAEQKRIVEKIEKLFGEIDKLKGVI